MSDSFSLMALPLEIRTRIYEIYWEDEKVNVHRGTINTGAQSLQLLCEASPIFEEEARPVFYRIAIWHYNLERVPIRDFCQLNRFPIRKIEIRGFPLPYGGLADFVNILNTSNGRPPGLAALKKVKFQVWWENDVAVLRDFIHGDWWFEKELTIARITLCPSLKRTSKASAIIHSDRLVTLGYILKDETTLGRFKTEVAALFDIDVANIRTIKDWEVGKVDDHDEIM